MNNTKIALIAVITALLLVGFIFNIDAKETRNISIEKPSLNSTAVFLDEEKDKGIVYVSNMLGLDPEVAEPVIEDEIEKLFNKFEVRYEYRDYTRQICELQNVDPLVFISLIQIESGFGTVKGYNEFLPYRMYGSKKQYADIGMGQLSSRYFEYMEEYHFNPSLIRSLGYVRTTFDARDPYINLQVAASYLSYLYKRFENYEEAIFSYNAGETRVSRGDIPQMTIRYTNAILKQYRYIDEGDV